VNEPEFRFYLLYDKHRTDVLLRAWALAKASNACPGVDGQSFGRGRIVSALLPSGIFAEAVGNGSHFHAAEG